MSCLQLIQNYSISDKHKKNKKHSTNQNQANATIKKSAFKINCTFVYLADNFFDTVWDM